MDELDNVNTERDEQTDEAATRPEDTSPEADTSIVSIESSARTPNEEREEAFRQFKAQLDSIDDVTAKLQLAIDFMEVSIAQKGSPHFKNFWEARKLCLEFFKENVSPGLRSSLWEKYTELSQEARRLKELLDEQSAFAAEQIEIAIAALEVSIGELPELVEKTTNLEIPTAAYTVRQREQEYQRLQKPIGCLNSFATKINSLRKELIRTDMRMKVKNQFFQRLSKVGDAVFPKRKELVGELSELYRDDVEQFARRCENKDAVSKNIRGFREEIKALQTVAKTLTLNTKTFSATRKKLSHCWDLVKELDKEHRKERAELRTQSHQNAENFRQQLEEFSKAYEAGELSGKAAEDKLNAIAQQMRKTQLVREDVNNLKQILNEKHRPLQEKAESERAQRAQQRQQAREKERKEKEKLHSEIKVLAEDEGSSHDELQKRLDECRAKMSGLSLTRLEHLSFEALMLDGQERIAVRALEEARQAGLSSDQAKTLLEQWHEFRALIREQLEILRRALGSSGQDFELAMAQRELMEEERARLERISQVIKELDGQIADPR